MNSVLHSAPATAAGVWRRAALALAWVAGVALQLQQPVLWSEASYPLLLGAGLGLGLVGVGLRARRATAAWLLAIAAAVALGFGFAGWRAQARLAQVLAPGWEGCDLELVGVVDDMPQVSADGTHFAFTVESARALPMSASQLRRQRRLAASAGMPGPAEAVASSCIGGRVGEAAGSDRRPRIRRPASDIGPEGGSDGDGSVDRGGAGRFHGAGDGGGSDSDSNRDSDNDGDGNSDRDRGRDVGSASASARGAGAGGKDGGDVDADGDQAADEAGAEFAPRRGDAAAGPVVQVRVPSRVWLAWNREQRDDQAVAAVPAPLRTGQRWRLPVRLRRPHGAMNPDGFDAELWLFDQNLRATGSVQGGGQLLASGWAPIAGLRQWIRDRLLLSAQEGGSDASERAALAALAVGDQAGVDSAAWEVFRNSGVAHLMSISGLHITMLAWLGGRLAGWLWRRCESATLYLPAPVAARWGGVLVAWIYALLAGWGVPAQRTVVMLAATAALRGAALDWPAALVAIVSLLPVTLLDPWALLQPGCWLSFAAVILLMTAGPARPVPVSRRSATGGHAMHRHAMDGEATHEDATHEEATHEDAANEDATNGHATHGQATQAQATQGQTAPERATDEQARLDHSAPGRLAALCAAPAETQSRDAAAPQRSALAADPVAGETATVTPATAASTSTSSTTAAAAGAATTITAAAAAAAAAAAVATAATAATAAIGAAAPAAPADILAARDPSAESTAPGTVASPAVRASRPWHDTGALFCLAWLSHVSRHLRPLRLYRPSALFPLSGPSRLLLQARPAWIRCQRATRLLTTHLRSGLRTQLIASVGLAPLTLVSFQQLSLVGLLANIVAEPWITLVVTPLALLGIAVPACWDLAAFALRPLLGLLAWMARWPYASVHVPSAPAWGLVAGLAGGMVLVLPVCWRMRLLGLPLLLPLVAPQVVRPPAGRFELVAADVGQGSAVLVRTRTHLLLFDTGPRLGADDDAGRRLLLPLLQARGESGVDMLVLSHADADHVGGAQSLIDRLPVASLSSSLGPRNPLRTNPLPHVRCAAGQRWSWDGVEFRLLHPAPADYRPGAKTNALSCVLHVRDAQGRSALLTGDIEAAQETALVAQGAAALASDVMLVPHHGSRSSSTPAFLAAVHPRVAVIQVGYRSRYGHPAPEVIARYLSLGIAVVRTDQCGAWAWSGNATVCTRAVRRRYWSWQGTAQPLTPARIAANSTVGRAGSDVAIESHGDAARRGAVKLEGSTSSP